MSGDESAQARRVCYSSRLGSSDTPLVGMPDSSYHPERMAPEPVDSAELRLVRVRTLGGVAARINDKVGGGW